MRAWHGERLRIQAAARGKGRAAEMYSWWSDYTEGEIESGGGMSVIRRIVSREGNTLVLEDRFRRPVPFTDITHVTLHPETLSISFISKSSMWNSTGTYRFMDEGEECSVSLDLSITPRGLLRLLLLLPPGRRWFISQFSRDIEGHMAEFQEERCRK